MWTYTAYQHNQPNRELLSRQVASKQWQFVAGSEQSPLTNEQTEDFTCTVVGAIYKVCRSVRLLQLFVITSYTPSRYPIINPNPMSNH
jgi:hypothetical protein